jgi:hypothetical protein
MFERGELNLKFKSITCQQFKAILELRRFVLILQKNKEWVQNQDTY